MLYIATIYEDRRQEVSCVSKTNSEKSVIVYGHFLVSDNFHTIKMWKWALVLSFINNTQNECFYG